MRISGKNASIAGKEFMLSGKIASDKGKSMISGKIVSGKGIGQEFLRNEIYSKEFSHLLGFTPYCGTFNIEIDKKSIEIIRSLDPEKFLEIKGFEFKGKKFNSVKLVKAKIFLQDANAKKPVPCAVVFPSRSTHPENIIEVIAAENLREEFGLNEGDIVSVEIV